MPCPAENPQTHCARPRSLLCFISPPIVVVYERKNQSAKINQQLQAGAGTPGERRGHRAGTIHPPKPRAGLAAEGQREGKGEERSENSFAARRPSLPFLPSFLVSRFQMPAGGEGHGGGREGAQGTPARAGTAGSRQLRGSPGLAPGASNATQLPPHGHPRSHPVRAPAWGRALLSPCCVGTGGTVRQGLPRCRTGGTLQVPGPAGHSSSALRASPVFLIFSGHAGSRGGGKLQK